MPAITQFVGLCSRGLCQLLLNLWVYVLGDDASCFSAKSIEQYYGWNIGKRRAAEVRLFAGWIYSLLLKARQQSRGQHLCAHPIRKNKTHLQCLSLRYLVAEYFLVTNVMLLDLRYLLKGLLSYTSRGISWFLWKFYMFRVCSDGWAAKCSLSEDLGSFLSIIMAVHSGL